MTQYEVTIIVDPVLSGDESKATAQTYQDMLTEKGGSIVNVDEIGLRSLAYPIKKRTTGVYYCIEFRCPGVVVDELELALRRDERIMRFLTVKLDKYGVKYNEDKRAGKIGKKRDKVSEEISEEKAKVEPAAAKPAPAPAPAPAPVAEANDLTKIEGIGPKINTILQEAGINTFAQLAATDADKVREILAAAGNRYKAHDPTTWGQQAELAAAGKTDELNELQDRLKGGKEVA